MCNMYIFLWCLFSIIIVVKSEGRSCFSNVIDIATGQPVKNVTKYCARTSCVFRYCERLDDILLNVNKKLTCLSPEELKSRTNITIQWPDVNQVYKKEGSYLKESAKSFRNDFKHLKYTDNTNFNCTKTTISYNNRSIKLHILEDGSLMQHLVQQNIDVQQPVRSFIVEYQIRNKKGKWIGPILTTKELVHEEETQQRSKFTYYYNSIGLLISCFFLTVLLVIYGLLRQLRCLAGLILMAHVFTINVGFLLMATIYLSLLLGTAKENFCRYTSIIMYFSLLSSFFWMNVMCFDIWWTFRGSVKSRDINRRGIIHKFCMYSLYAFGGPLVLVAIALVIDTVDPTNTMKIVKPGFASCLLDSSLVYLYIPITTMILVNVIFFILTSVNIYRLKSFINNSLKNNTSTKKNENRFILYIKLFLITGINWIVDFVLFLTNPPDWVEYIPDTYNMLIGVVIFAMYICKRKILLQICNRFSIFGRFAPMFQPSRSSQKTFSTKVSENRNNSVVD